MAVKLVWSLVLLAGAIASAEETLGNEASIEDFPSLAQVESRVGSLWVLQCVGIVLTNRHLLAPASCFSDVPDFVPEYYRVRVGTSHRGVDGEVFAVESVVRHPNYGLLGSEADLAVVRLDDYLTLNPVVQQAAILGQGIELPDGLGLLLAGWGSTVQGGKPSNDNLYSLGLVVYNNDNCMDQYNEDKIITENMLCVGLHQWEGRDFDTEDLGAPLYFSNTLVGILVAGERADDELPLVATHIGSYTEWIIDTASA